MLGRVGYGMTFWASPNGQSLGWRVSIALSFIPALAFLAGLPFMHES